MQIISKSEIEKWIRNDVTEDSKNGNFAFGKCPYYLVMNISRHSERTEHDGILIYFDVHFENASSLDYYVKNLKLNNKFILTHIF